MFNDKNNFNEAFISGITGIKRVKRQKKIACFNPDNAVIFSEDTEKVFVPGQGLVKKKIATEILLDCGHPSSNGFGHASECGHSVCKECKERYVLVCGLPGHQFKKLCTVEGCVNLAMEYRGIYLCREHERSELTVALLSLGLFGLRVTDEMRREYFSHNSLPQRKELPDERQFLPNRPVRIYRIAKGRRTA